MAVAPWPVAVDKKTGIMAMKQTVIKNNSVGNCLSRLHGLALAALLCLISLAFIPILAADNNSSDPVNCVSCLPPDPQRIPVDIGTKTFPSHSQLVVRVP